MDHHNTYRLIEIFKDTLKQHIQVLVTNWINQGIISNNIEEYENATNDTWTELQDHIFDISYTGINILLTPELIIRCLNFIKESELSEFGEMVSFINPKESYNIQTIIQYTSFILIEFELFEAFKTWVMECLEYQTYSL
jgi:hypothetical protein